MLSTVEKVLHLRQIPLFAHVPGEELARVARIAREVLFAPGEALIVEGDVGDAAYLLIEGEVRVHLGNGETTTLGPGQLVGEMAIIDSEPRSATVMATQALRTLKIEREDFTDLLSERSEIALAMIRMLSDRLRRRTQA